MKSKIIIAMGISLLVGFLTLGFLAFPLGIPVCGAIGLIYGFKNKDRNFTMGSLITLLIGIACVIYTFLLIHNM